MDKREPCPRRALAAVAARRSESLTALSRMIRRPPGYLGRFVRDGVPTALKEEEHELLAAHAGVDSRELGVRELWVPL